MNNPIFAEKYRPKLIDDCILPSSIKNKFKKYVENGTFPNLLLTGTSGTGKTTVARALCNELGYDVLEINASLDGNIDTLRTKVQGFASSYSMDGTRKCVIFDEADYLNLQSTQPSLRNFLESYSNNTSFIFTCNYPNRILDAIKSRCSIVNFSFTKDESKSNVASFYKRIVNILNEENIKFDDKVLLKFIVKHAPDFRKILNEIQAYCVDGILDEGILGVSKDTDINVLITYLKDKDFKNARLWVIENKDNDPNLFYRKLYNILYETLEPQSVPDAILILAEYQYKQAFAIDMEINLCACLIEIMSQCSFR